MPRFKLDENLAGYVAERLHSVGLDVDTVAEENLSGADDPAVWRVSQEEGRCLMTLDLDSTDIRRYDPIGTPGIVVLRPEIECRSVILRLVDNVLAMLRQIEPNGRVWIVDSHKVRVRGEA